MEQDNYVEVWIEKEALAGIFNHICNSLDVPFFACRGYVSQSEQYAAGKRLERIASNGRHVTVIHLGDHDPSGIDMTRDNDERLWMFANGAVEVKRIALNMDQVEEHNPPPNPAKITDTRYDKYVEAFGDESWELDALNPEVLEELVREHVEPLRDMERWNATVEREKKHKKQLGDVVSNWDIVHKFLEQV